MVLVVSVTFILAACIVLSPVFLRVTSFGSHLNDTLVKWSGQCIFKKFIAFVLIVVPRIMPGYFIHTFQHRLEYLCTVLVYFPQKHMHIRWFTAS